MLQPLVVFAVLALTLVLLAWGRWRYDIVGLLALLAVTITGIIPGEQAFAGFGHPAVITVAAVLVLSRGLQNSGVVSLLARPLAKVGESTTVQVGALTSLVAALSAFMNNVGALALFLPVAIRMARRSKRSPSLLLMPLAFASLLGGLITLIGTPPNIIIATFRAEVNGDAFRMFDFTPVGLGVAVAGLAFVALIGWRLVPRREGAASRSELFEIGDYVTEVTVTEGSALAGKRLRDLGSISDAEVTVIGLVRNGLRQYNPSSFEVLLVGDLLVVEADSRDLQALVDDAGLEMGGSPKRGEEALGVVGQRSLMEAVVVAGSPIIGETARTLNLRWRHGVNLLGVARLGARIHQRMRDIHFQVGDVLLLQGATDAMGNTLSALGCLPLAGRELDIGRPRQVGLGLALFAGALLLAAFGALPIQVAFVAAAVAMLLTNLITLSEAYESIDWSIIVLLGAMIPVGQALEVSGGADLVARSTLSLAGRYPPVVSLIVVLVATMFLSDLVNNAAAAVLMAPIAISVAQGLSASPDPFLMAVAIGASCAFLTPIGHQSNTLVMGPGGYRFGDYWRMGLMLEVIIVVVAVPLIVHFWPFATI